MITYEHNVTDTINAAMATLDAPDTKVLYHRYTCPVEALPELVRWANVSHLIIDVYNYDDLWVHGTLTKVPTLYSLLKGSNLVAVPAAPAV